MHTHQGLDGRPGLAYDYVFAGNGVFIQSANRLLTARFPIATARIAGLPPIGPELTLHHGPMPAAILAQAIHRMMTNTRRELYCAVLHDEPQGYHLAIPPQEATGHSVTYEPVAGAVMDIHSHPNNAALFSATDDADETAFRLYAVIGPLAPPLRPSISIRVGIYGQHHPVDWQRVFSHPELSGLTQHPPR